MAVLFYCAWEARALLDAWRHSPLDAFGWAAFLIWIFPAAIVVWRRRPQKLEPLLLGAGLLLSFAGAIGSLHLLSYWGLAFAVAGFGRISVFSLIWLAGAIGWMPMFGWFNNGLSGVVVAASRCTIAALGTIAFFMNEPDPRQARVESALTNPNLPGKSDRGG